MKEAINILTYIVLFLIFTYSIFFFVALILKVIL
jgi:hypothetical protein